MAPPTANLALAEMFDAFHRTPDICRPLWRASFEICCLSWGLHPAREWERLLKFKRHAEGK